MKFEDVIYAVESAFDFILNMDFIQKDTQAYTEAEQDRDNVVSYLNKLKQDKEYYFEKLCIIKDLAIHDPDTYETIIEVLDAD